MSASSCHPGPRSMALNQSTLNADTENGNEVDTPRRRSKLNTVLINFSAPWRKHKPIPRKDLLASRLIKIVACLATILCIVQYIIIQRLKDGLLRVPNDPFDILFGKDITRNSPEIWDDNRQKFIRNRLPVPVHSHNDYWRRIPLFEALGSGCISVEADVHLRGSDLLVGHDATSLQSTLNLRTMYLEPLQRIVRARNSQHIDKYVRGIFDLAPDQTVVLLVDLKTSGPETFTELHRQLQPLRDHDYLTYWNGTTRISRPITIVASGNSPFESVIALNATHRDIFWDAKLENLISVQDNFDTDPITYKYNRSNSYFASTEFRNAILYRYHNMSAALPNTPQMKDITSTQLEQAKSRGLLARYWNTPSQPPNLREIAWRVLVENEVDILNMDDLGVVRARAKGWGNIRP